MNRSLHRNVSILGQEEFHLLSLVTAVVSIAVASIESSNRKIFVISIQYHTWDRTFPIEEVEQ